MSMSSGGEKVLPEKYMLGSSWRSSTSRSAPVSGSINPNDKAQGRLELRRYSGERGCVPPSVWWQHMGVVSVSLGSARSLKHDLDTASESAPQSTCSSDSKSEREEIRV
eukprot:6475071-Prymnesium_polylepis.1